MFIDGDFFESLSDIKFGDPYTGLLHPVSVFNSMESIKIFSEKNVPILVINNARILQLFSVVSQINKEFVIIGHNCDVTFNDSIVGYIPNNVKCVWLQNYNGTETDKIKSLPIGLERKRWFPDQRKQDVIKENMNSIEPRKDSVYMNFSTQTNPIRKKWFEHLKGKDFITTEMFGSVGNYPNYISKLKEYKFIISPPGNGIDCHRNWEAIYMGCIPIMEKSKFTLNMFKDMPVIMVDSYKDITKELLNTSVGNNIDKLSTEYWRNKILNSVK